MAIWRGLEVASLENCENYLDISLTPLNVTPRCQQYRTSSADLLRHEDAICAGGEAGSPPPPDFSPSRRRLCVVHGVSTVLSPASDPNLTATPLSTTQMADTVLEPGYILTLQHPHLISSAMNLCIGFIALQF